MFEDGVFNQHVELGDLVWQLQFIGALDSYDDSFP